MEYDEKERAGIEPISWQIWIVIVLLGIEGIGNLLGFHLIWLGAKILIIAGLVKGWRWVYILSMVLCGFHAFYFANAGFLFTASINLVLVILQLWAWRYYFGKLQAMRE